MVNGYVSPEHAVIDHLECGKSSVVMMLSVLEKYLSCLECLLRNDSVMVIRVQVLITVHVILFVLVLEHISRKRFPGEDVSAVSLVSEYVSYGSVAPLFHPGFSRTVYIGEESGDLTRTFACEKCVKYETDHFGFFFDNLKPAVFYVVSGRITRTFVSQKFGRQQFAGFEPLGKGPVHAFAFFDGFLLCECGQERKHQF